MPPSKKKNKKLNEAFVNLICKFVSDIKNGKLRGSTNIALAMVTLLETIINQSKHDNVSDLLGAVRGAGRRVSGALPHAPAAANMARRVLRAIRDESRAAACQGGEAVGESLARLVLAPSARRLTLSGGSAPLDLREPLRAVLGELRSELEGAESAVCSAARDHLQADELILTYGASPLVERALRTGNRNYRLIVAEGPDFRESQAMASRLSAAGLSVTVVSAAAVYAVMSRVNKVVLSAAAALCGGAVLLAPGARAVTAAARRHCVPVLALAPLHVLCPLHVADSAQYAALSSPADCMPYERHETCEAQVYAPRDDFAPPDHVTLFITNLGGSSPSYMYRMLSELYDPSDHTL